MTGTDALFGQTSDSRIGFWLRRVLALIAGNLVVHFLPVGVIFRGARPRRQILRRTAGPCRYVVRHMAGARCESGRDNHQCNQTSHDGIRKKAGGGSECAFHEKAPPVLGQAGLRNGWGEERTPTPFYLADVSVRIRTAMRSDRDGSPEHVTAEKRCPSGPKVERAMGPGTPPQTVLPVAVAGFSFGASWAGRVGNKARVSAFSIKCHGPFR
jgi:hypothetical protein